VEEAFAGLKEIIESDPPYGAQVTLDKNLIVPGFYAEEFPAWCEEAANWAANEVYGDTMQKTGVGGCIGFVNQIQTMFESSGTIVHNTGLGPSNAHAPDEFIDLDSVKKFTGVVAYLINVIAEGETAEQV
jgi:acetylornithine deacetylase/succinyl-diaminopimelate desuccinylase-like protein